MPLPAQTQPEPVKTSITVIEKIASEAPAAISVFNEGALKEIPGVDLDERLRSLPGFSLFRRNPALTAHPTTQGVSLRGLGSSGASRTLVLWDGIPVNDPFGGWVYWTRFDPEALDRVEVTRGSSTSAFGDRALGGVIGIFRREPRPKRIDASFDAGNRSTAEASLGGSHLASRWAVSANARSLGTGGYYIVPDGRRGSADQPAAVHFAAGDARVDWYGAPGTLFLKFDALAEDRDNGTALQHNSTSLGAIAAHYVLERKRDSFSLVGFHTREVFRSSFSSISADRNTERITFTQRVPAEGLGAAALWNHTESAFSFLAGADVYRAGGWNTDTFSPTNIRVGGGTQLQHGLFGQVNFALRQVRLFAGARQQAAGGGVSFFSPNAGITAGWRRLRARGSVYRGFRAPTLNELFREFRVGNIVTQANPTLRPETLFGAEAGFDLTSETRRASLTFFRCSLDDVITNVTLSTAPNLTIRQRRNAASALSRGFEASARQNWREWSAELAYLFADSRFSTGERLPQVARHQASAQLAWSHGGTLAAFGARAWSLQFDDDRNQVVLPGFNTLFLALRQRITAHFSAHLAMDNIASRRYITGYTATPVPGAPVPVPNIGAPRLWRVGVRWDGI